MVQATVDGFLIIESASNIYRLSVDSCSIMV